MRLTELYQQDYSSEAGKNLPPELLEMVYQTVLPQELDWEDVPQLTKELIEKGYTRTEGSAKFALTRMHILVHGVAPHGLSEKSAESFFTPSRRMEQFVEGKGIDVDSNIKAARRELATRLPPKGSKAYAELKHSAWQKMFDYYRANKESLPPTITHYKDEIIDAIIQGAEPHQAFAEFM